MSIERVFMLPCPHIEWDDEVWDAEPDPKLTEIFNHFNNKTMEKTLGENRVRTDFNVNNNSQIDVMKHNYAKIIDYLQAHRNDEVSKTYDKSEEELKRVSGEKLRLISIAQTKAEEAAMWAVKAITA